MTDQHEIKEGLLARLGIRFHGIYKDGELVDFGMHQTPIRRVLNWIWCGWNNWRHGDPFGRGFYGGKSDCEEFPDYLPAFWLEGEN